MRLPETVLLHDETFRVVVDATGWTQRLAIATDEPGVVLGEDASDPMRTLIIPASYTEADAKSAFRRIAEGLRDDRPDLRRSF